MDKGITEIFEKGSDKLLSQRKFFIDFKRFSEELFVNGDSVDEILLPALEHIEVVNLSIQAIFAAAKIIKQNPDQIKIAYLKVASILEKAPEQFESKLLSAVSILETEMPEIIALRSVIPILKAAKTKAELPNQEAKSAFLNAASVLYSTPMEQGLLVEQKITTDPIEIEWRKTLSMLAQLNTINSVQETVHKSKINCIETILLNNAANAVFNKLFEKEKAKNKEEKNLKSDFNKSKKEQWIEEKSIEFFKLFLHQGFLYSNINLLSKLSSKYVFLNPLKRVDLINNEDGLFIQISFFTDQIFDNDADQLLESHQNPYIKGVAKYKVSFVPYNGEGWVAQVDLIDSSLEASEHFKAINSLGKFQEFLDSILAMLKSFLNLEVSLNSNKPKFKSFFFASSDGQSVLSTPPSADNPNCGKILNILMDRMTH